MDADGLDDGVEDALADGLIEGEADPEADALGLLDADGLTDAEATNEISYSFTNSTNGRVTSLTTFE